MNAFSGKWHEILHVSECKMNRICKRYEQDILKIEDARLYRPEGEKSAFAVLKGTRYGIPDEDTQEEIWGKTEPAPSTRARLDRFLPGRDLVSVQFWPLQDQTDQSSSGKSVES